MKTLTNNIPFSIAEEILDNYSHLYKNNQTVTEQDLILSVGKSKSYVKNALNFLRDILIIEKANNKINEVSLNTSIKEDLIQQQIPPEVLIRRSIISYPAFNSYCYFQQIGKTEKVSARLSITKHSISIEESNLVNVFNKWLKYLDKDLIIKKSKLKKINSLTQTNAYIWVDEEGKLMFDEEGYIKKIVDNLEKNRLNNQFFIDPNRLTEISNIKNANFDLKKLVRYCEEINSGYRFGNYCSVAVLIRATLDHIPPIFGKKNFSEVANNYGSKSFKDSMTNLDSFARKIADGIMHSHIRKVESIPNPATVDCKNVFDVLLAEIITVLK